jgi:hypothetical protein
MLWQHLRRILLPSLMVAAGWALFVYSADFEFKHVLWDFAAPVLFAALVSGWLVLPYALLVSLVSWVRAPRQEKALPRSSFLGWLLAIPVLWAGFQIVPWSGILGT